MQAASRLETASVDPAIALGAMAASPFPTAVARARGPLPEALPIAAAWEWGAVVPVSLAEASRRPRLTGDRVALAVVSLLSIAAAALAACL